MEGTIPVWEATIKNDVPVSFKIGEYYCICIDSDMFECASWDGIVQVELKKTNRVIDHFEQRCAQCHTL